MDELRERLEEVTSELGAAEADRARLDARIRGLVAERDALSAAVHEADEATLGEGGQDLSNLLKADAILAVLREAGRPLRIGGIVEALRAHGRPRENYNGIAVYLNWMVNTGVVRRVDRGLYMAA